jgi:SAM-dependent methyltransferase
MRARVGVLRRPVAIGTDRNQSERLRMERSEYQKLDRLEDRMWWFAAGHRNLLTLSRWYTAVEAGEQPILDAGCGTGGFLARLAARYPHRTLFGLDVDASACRRAAIKSARPVCTGSINALPFPEGVFEAVFSADVLCHRAVDERCAVLQFHRCLASNGRLIVNVPAYGWMLSRHDAAVHNVRRYTIKSLSLLLESAGFRLIYATYWNAVLFPLMVLTRKFLPESGDATSDVLEYPRPLDVICRAATSLETALLRRGLRLPFGGSVIAIAIKEGSAHGQKP